MTSKVFLDINVVLDFLDHTRVFGKLAPELMQRLIVNNVKISISEDMLTTIYYINPDKNKTLKFFKSIQKKWNIYDFKNSVISEAIDLSLEKNLDLEDILQCLCAKKNGCDILITNDKKFYDCGVKVMSSQEFLERN